MSKKVKEEEVKEEAKEEAKPVKATIVVDPQFAGILVNMARKVDPYGMFIKSHADDMEAQLRKQFSDS